MAIDEVDGCQTLDVGLPCEHRAVGRWCRPTGSPVLKRRGLVLSRLIKKQQGWPEIVVIGQDDSASAGHRLQESAAVKRREHRHLGCLSVCEIPLLHAAGV